MKRSKRVLSLLLVLAMLFSMAGCQSQPAAQPPAEEPPAADAMYTPGTYTGKGAGINGEIEVEVTVAENEITNIKVLSHNETPGVSDLALSDVPANIVEHQSLGIDAIAGATYSSEGIIEAAANALSQAGADIDALKAKVVETEKGNLITTEKEVDVVVIGGGGAGLAAAVSAHENGASVLLLEKMPKVGGNTIISGAAYNCVDPIRQAAAGIEDSVDKHFQQTYEGGDKVGNPELIRVLVENAYPTLQWLEGLGMEFTDYVFTVLGGLWPRAHRPAMPLGTGYIATYMNYIENNSSDMEVMLNTQAKHILLEDGKAVGVSAEGPDGPVIVRANKGVVIATGGFSKNVELRNKYNKTWGDLTNALSTNHPGATGDGIIMAEEIGANFVGMEYIQLLPLGDPETGSLAGNIEQAVENRIFVNKDGNRFVDEGGRRDDMTKALFEQRDEFLWIILDSHNYPTGDTKNNFNETIDELVAAGRAYKADTLEDLAAQIGVNADNLVAAVEDFNAHVESKEPDEFGRTLYQWKMDTPPYYAGARKPTVHHTMGGIEINTEAQVIDTQGNIIPGLYAAGEVTGGIHGSNRLGGNALADINTFGRIAGRNAATK
ncbi:MAG TPA: flavocytochrome c [Sedimentibacter sp.]|nr:flavocytochrome c [Sedimentibacter sp.]